MAIQSALKFIHHVMNNDDGRRSIRDLGVDADLDSVARLGRNCGYKFSPDEFRQAFKIDWQMRAKYYSSLSD